MQHGHLIEKYNKAQHHFNKKKCRRAKRLFESISAEIYASDTDCMADIHLCSSAQEYLNEISEIEKNKIGFLQSFLTKKRFKKNEF